MDDARPRLNDRDMDVASVGVEVHRLRAGSHRRLERNRPALMVVLKGRGICSTGGRSVQLTQDAALVVPAEHAQVRAQDDLVFLAIESFGGVKDGLVLSPELVTRSPALSVLGELLRAETSEPATRNGALVAALAKSFALYLERAVASRARKKALGSEIGDAQVLRAMTLMQTDPARRWTVERLARNLGLSRPVFARRFAKSARVTPLRYLTHCRMELAAELLCDSDAALAEVATKVGYESEFAFGRAFKRHHGVSPGVFRRRSSPSAVTMMRSAA